MSISVVIPTRDRPDDLARCLGALRSQTFDGDLEIIVVDDAGRYQVSAPNARVIRANGAGPAAARNRGVEVASGDIVLFTDDDAVPDPNWVAAASAFLDGNPDHVGVEGPIDSEPFDYLYEHSLCNSRPGAYWTCNVAYRTAVLRELGGFSEEFPHAHCEDLDLGFRASKRGRIGFSPDMRVVHVPRPVRLRELVGRARLAPSELELFRLHPDRYRPPYPIRLLPIAGAVRLWTRRLRADWRPLLRNPRRVPRFFAASFGHIALTAVTVLVTPRWKSS